MNQISKTARIIEYGEMSKDYDFRDDIECVLERDYAEYPGLYYLDLLEHLELILRLVPELTPQEVLELVEQFRESMPENPTGSDELTIPGLLFEA
jgi:hypothetical protein